MPPPQDQRGLSLLLDEYYAAEDSRFPECLHQIRSPKVLAAFTDRWKKDPRPWARQQIFEYLKLPLSCPGHHPVIKRLFKHAEEMKDDELMATFLVTFDCLVRRHLKVIRKWDFRSRVLNEEEVLVTPRNQIFAKSIHGARDPMTGEKMQYNVKVRPNSRLFSYRTRYYLRRRASRYFRYMGYQRPADYPSRIAAALKQYSDQDLAKGENILDSWGLMNACFRGSDVLEFKASTIEVKEGCNLSDLTPAPRFPNLWHSPEAALILFSLICAAQSRVVRVWAMSCLRDFHRDWTPAPEDILKLLNHSDSEIQQFGATQLSNLKGLEKMPVFFWLRLLEVQDPTVLQTICDAFAKNVGGDRLDLAQCIDIAMAQPAPVARLGLQFLQKRSLKTSADRAALTRLAGAKCAAIGRDLAIWTLSILGTRENYQVDQIIAFLDSLLPEVRLAAWDWLIADSAGYNDPVLWSRLTETPFDDLRLKLVEHLEKRVKLPGTDANQLSLIWCSVLLGVHRGGRQKLKAVHQIGEAIQRTPAQIDSLLPVLAVAVRSVRLPEARAGLAAVVTVVEAQPELAGKVKKYLPELELSPAEVGK